MEFAKDKTNGTRLIQQRKGLSGVEKFLSVATAPKTATFQMRINPEVKERVEAIYAKCGLTLTDAVNIFIQQSMNVEGLPFLVIQDSKEALHEQAISELMVELKKGVDSIRSEEEWLTERILMAGLGGKS